MKGKQPYVTAICDENDYKNGYEHHCPDPDECAITVLVNPIDSESFDVVITKKPTQIFVERDFTIPENQETKEQLIRTLFLDHYSRVDEHNQAVSIQFCDKNGEQKQRIVLRDTKPLVDIVAWNDRMQLNHKPVPDFVVYVGSSLPSRPADGSGIVTWYAKAEVKIRLFGQGTVPSTKYVQVKKPGTNYTMYPRDVTAPNEVSALIPKGVDYDKLKFDRDVTMSKAVSWSMGS